MEGGRIEKGLVVVTKHDVAAVTMRLPAGTIVTATAPVPDPDDSIYGYRFKAVLADGRVCYLDPSTVEKYRPSKR
jgi:hypothetical protein